MSAWTWYLYILVPIVYYILAKWVKPWLKAAKFIMSLPGPPVLPIIGNIFHTRKNVGFLDFLATANRDYGSVIGSWVSIIPIVIVTEPRHVQIILGNSKYTEKSIFYSVLKIFGGDGILTNSGSRWKSHRKYMQPYFNRAILEQYIPVLSECSQAIIQNLKNAQEVKITQVMQDYISSVLHQVILGIPLEDADSKNNSPFLRVKNTAIERFFKPWLILNSYYKLTRNFQLDRQHQESFEEFTANALKKLKNRRKNKEVLQWTFLEYLLEISETVGDFTELDVVKEASSLMIAGQDSTQLTLSFVLYFLAKHQDVQEKVVEELDGIFSRRSSCINSEVLGEMKYLEKCIKETMRLCPVAPIMARILHEDVKLDNLLVPAGCNIFVSPYATHRLPHHYPDPDKFNPERFSGINEENRQNFAYIPFSAGPRNCIAQKLAMFSMKTILSTFLRSYKVHISPGNEKLNFVYRITLKAKERIYLRLEPRNGGT